MQALPSCIRVTWNTSVLDGTFSIGGQRTLCVYLTRIRSIAGRDTVFAWALRSGGRTGNLISQGWFHISVGEERDLSEPQRRLLLAARERLDSLAPSKASASESWASREPGRRGTGTPVALRPIRRGAP
jgi:hypothetical protein